MLQRARQLQESLSDLRREVHRYPELAFREKRTGELAARRLVQLGITARTGVAKTGVVGDLGDSGPRIALRADMDALPIQECSTQSYASQVPGIMHACGHDTHVACLLGAAQLLAEEAAAGRLPGRVRFLFQPAEEEQDGEGKSGGMRMVDEGVMDGVDGVVGLHVWSELPVGQMEVREGPMSAYPDTFQVVIKGKEAHGAFPQHGVDAVVLAAQVINAMQTVISRRVDPTAGRVLTIATIHGGTKDNIIAHEVTMGGTIRTFEPEIRDTIFAEMERACGVARALGGDYELTIRPGYIPVVNDSKMTALVREVGADLLGRENVLLSKLNMGGEDFSYMAREAPGCFFFLGGAPLAGPIGKHHQVNFDVDERCLPLGAALLAETAIRFLRSRA